MDALATLSFALGFLSLGPAQIGGASAPPVSSLRRALPLDGASTAAYATLDANEDGIPDLFLANRGANALVFGDGDGGFVDALLPPGDAQARDVVVGDFDGNGTSDLYVANEDGDELLLGMGASGFVDASLGLPASGLVSAAVAAADVDGDGDLDVALGGDGSRVRLLRNDGSATFVDDPTAFPSFGRQANDMAFADLRGIGAVDLAVATGAFGNQQAELLFRNDGTGTFTDDSAGLAFLGPGQTMNVFVPDADADGMPDLLFVRTVGNVLALADGSGGWLDGVGLLPPPTNQAVRHLRDFDGDGAQDLLLRDGGLYLFDGAGWASNPPVAQVPFGFFAPQIVFDADLDGDLDAVAVNFWAEDVYLDAGGFDFQLLVPEVKERFPVPLHQGIPTRTAAGDVDGDGDLDMAMAVQTDFSGRSLNLFRNDGSGSFDDVTAANLPMVYNSGYCAAFFDVEGDGDLDLLHGNAHGNDFFRNDGKGSFTFEIEVVPLVRGAHELAVGDVDDDGDPDVFAAQDGTRNNLFRNIGGALVNDVASVTVNPPQASRDVLLADVDVDGDLDVVVANGLFFTGDVGEQLLLNDGLGTFRDGNALLPATNTMPATSVAAGDVDGDGDVDLFVGTAEEDYSVPVPDALWLQDGGRFVDASTNLPAYTTRASVVALADFDLDGNLDVAVTGVFFDEGTRDRVLHGDGTGRFSIGWESGPPGFGNTTDVLVDDFDGDGDPDALFIDGQPRLIVGLGRHTSRRAPLRLGRATELLVAGPPSTPWRLYLAAAPARIATDLGTLLFSPSSAYGPPFLGTLDPLGRARLQLPIPADPSLVGVPLLLQTLVGQVGPALRFTNAEPGTIEEF